MELTFLGVGGAFARTLYNSNVLMTSKNQTLLIDCGSDCLLSLAKIGYSIRNIENLFITHLHGDHVHGIEEFAIRAFLLNHRPKLIIRPELKDRLWQTVLSGGMEFFHGQTRAMTLEDYFDLYVTTDPFTIGDVQITTIPTKHVAINGNWTLFPSFGLEFQTRNNQYLLFTGDTTFDLELLHRRHWHTIFHDCTLVNSQTVPHTTYTQLLTLPIETRLKMWLYHYDEEWEQFNPTADGFAGFVRIHQKFVF